MAAQNSPLQNSPLRPVAHYGESRNYTLDHILVALGYSGPRPRRHYMCHCPAHDDHTPSLSVTSTADGTILMHCFAGCRTAAVVEALHLTLRDLFPDAASGNVGALRNAVRDDGLSRDASKDAGVSRDASKDAGAPRKAVREALGVIVACYDYGDAEGKPLCQVVRFEPKSFRQRRYVNGEWRWGLGRIQPPLYRLPELLAAPAEAWIFVVEGEKDVEMLAQLGLVATCNIGGAGKWRPSYNQWLQDRRVCILPDNDAAGRAHAESVLQHLTEVARVVKIVALPALPAKGDVSDWIMAGGDRQTLLDLVDRPVQQELFTLDDSPCEEGWERGRRYT